MQIDCATFTPNTERVEHILEMARRAAGMLKRVSKETPIIFTGGVANNACMVRQVTAELGSEVIVPPQPHLVGAYGAALLLLRNKG